MLQAANATGDRGPFRSEILGRTHAPEAEVWVGWPPDSRCMVGAEHVRAGPR